MNAHMPPTVIALAEYRPPLHRATLHELVALTRAGDDRARQAVFLRLDVMEAAINLEEAEALEIEYSE